MYQTTAVTGTRKLPSRTTVGIMLKLPVTAVTSTDAIQRTSPTRKRRTQLRGGEFVRLRYQGSFPLRGVESSGLRLMASRPPYLRDSSPLSRRRPAGVHCAIARRRPPGPPPAGGPLHHVQMPFKLMALVLPLSLDTFAVSAALGVA